MKIQRILIGTVALFVSLSVLADQPAISNVVVHQRWPWSRLVDIDYVLDCDPGQVVDVVASAYMGSEALDVPETSFSGDFYGVKRGSRRITWDPTVTTYTNNGVIPAFNVVLTPQQAPLYMIVDLTVDAGATNQIAYVYEEDLTNGLWGAWERNPIIHRGTPIESVIWTGVTTNDIYKTDKLVLRRIPKGTFNMGGTTSTTLTKDFYAAVFQMTMRQWELITGSTAPGSFTHPAYYETRPVTLVSYNTIRGATHNVPAIIWPETGSSVHPSSFLGKFREKTGLVALDLPTEAQWEYACRAKTTTIFNDGDVSVNFTGDNSDTNIWMNVLGRYKYNGGSLGDISAAECTLANGTAGVGSYAPNAWGMYDMHGNVWEWCLDWRGTLAGGEDPKGPESGYTTRVFRGGSWSTVAVQCRSSQRNGSGPNNADHLYGFRVVLSLP